MFRWDLWEGRRLEDVLAHLSHGNFELAVTMVILRVKSNDSRDMTLVTCATFHCHHHDNWCSDEQLQDDLWTQPDADRGTSSGKIRQRLCPELLLGASNDIDASDYCVRLFHVSDTNSYGLDPAYAITVPKCFQNRD